MWTAIIVLGLLLLPILLVGGYAVSKYNTLVRLENRYENAYSQIDVQLKRRHDLIPNLVETAKGYLEHEQDTLDAVMSARNEAQAACNEATDRPGDPDSMQKLSAAESSLSSSLGQLLMVAEDYPNLKANQTISKLIEELRSTENKVAFARQAYNDAVMRYNTERESFPTVLLAVLLGYGEAEPFELDQEAEREAVEVTFGSDA